MQDSKSRHGESNNHGCDAVFSTSRHGCRSMSMNDTSQDIDVQRGVVVARSIWPSAMYQANSRGKHKQVVCEVSRGLSGCKMRPS